MKKWNYYNDTDPFICQWVKNLIAAGLVPDGEVDSRSIAEVAPNEIKDFIQCHFFCGILGWPYALQLAGWPENREVWTGSCPCQPFSVAGKGAGTTDERHLWPAFRRLISERRPTEIFGEQVASKDGRLWLAGVRADLEAMGYGVGASDLCAAIVGAPHIRQRLFWVANNIHRRPQNGRASGHGKIRHRQNEDLRPATSELCTDGRLADALPTGRPERGAIAGSGSVAECGATGGVGESDSSGPQPRSEPAKTAGYRNPIEPTGFWSDSGAIQCSDGKARRIPTQSALFPLAYGLPGRVGLLKGAGNSIVPQLAAEFIKAFMEVSNG